MGVICRRTFYLVLQLNFITFEFIEFLSKSLLLKFVLPKLGLLNSRIFIEIRASGGFCRSYNLHYSQAIINANRENIAIN